MSVLIRQVKIWRSLVELMKSIQKIDFIHKDIRFFKPFRKKEEIKRGTQIEVLSPKKWEV